MDKAEDDNILRSMLLSWYEHLSTRRVDLVGDYAGNELFLLEGDSLLLHCFSDPLLDFEGGFQILHAVYLVENFLHNLVRRKCNFHIVFFECNASLCVPSGAAAGNRPKFLLARSVIQRHLATHLPKSHDTTKFYTFDSYQDAEFYDYLKLNGTYFVMCHDGATPSMTASRAEQDEETVAAPEEVNRKKDFRAMIFKFVHQGYNIALINGLECLDTKVMTLVLEGPRRSHSSIEKDVDQEAKQQLEKCITANGHAHGDGMSILTTHFERLKVDLSESNGVNPKHDCRQQLSERACLVILALSQILKNDPGKVDLAGQMLAHLVLLEHLPLSNRRQKAGDLASDSYSRVHNFVAEFATTCTRILASRTWLPDLPDGSIAFDLADLIDGNLFMSVTSLDPVVLSEPAYLARFDDLANVLSAVSDGNKLHVPEHGESHKTTNGASPGSDPKYVHAPGAEWAEHTLTILPFSNSVFDRHMVSIKLNVPSAKTSDKQMGRIYQEVTHWHNVKRKLDPKANVKELSVREKKKITRRNDFFMAEMQAYAASLTNAVGKSLEPEIVTTSEKPAFKTKENDVKLGDISKSGTSKTAQKGKPATKKQAMLESLSANKAAKDNQAVDKDLSAWRNVRTDLAAEKTLFSQYFKMKAYLANLPDAKKTNVQAEVMWHLIVLLVTIYGELCKGSEAERKAKETERRGVAALLFDTARKLAKMEGLTKTIAQQLELIINTLQLPAIEIASPSVDRKLAYDPRLRLPSGTELAIAMSSQEFQLGQCGPYMDRNLDSAPDSRVPFEPDGWQRKVLDELDADRSVFVVAPTSAGKTFISFYAMEKILRANDDSILVYVAPTKALVNQIAAEVQARFRKTYKHGGKSVWAIHTRDYRINNPSGCQILVTVPHILQIMLLSPSNAKSWSPKVRYIIFDEIHSIGQAEDGVVWEQLLLLAPCPIIALSATVGNPQAFASWLSSTQESQGQQLNMIQHQHRYSDLRKFVFVPPKSFSFRGLGRNPTFGTLGLDGLDGLNFIHPVSSLVDRSRGMPEDLSFEARDCFSLFNAMARNQTEDFPVSDSLDPANALPKLIRKKDIIQWEKGLKQLLMVWMSDERSPFASVVEELGRSMLEPRRMENHVSNGEALADGEKAETVDPHELCATTLPLLCQLHERDALPAIFFNYDRHRCEGICQAVIKDLESAERRFKDTNPAWKKKVAAFEEWKKVQSAAAAKKGPKKPASKKKGNEDDDPGSKMDRMQDAAASEMNPFEGFDPEDPVEGYHFAAKQKADAKDLETFAYHLKRRGLPQWLMDGLKRGLGVHHAGMNRKYRQVVEMLFRKGYLRVIIATGTLALGINMPCATVVFSGDSVFLTALNFRQAAGRAGRRGFDLLGNVVFQGLSHSKICRLMSSRLPDLNGHFPVTTTLVLRLFTLLHESGSSPYAVRAINSLLSQPRLYLDGPAFKDQVLHHLRFSIEYLRRQDLLSAQGAPINFAGLTSHLYFTENSSFALNALIKGGYFHETCADIKEKESSVLRTLMLVMSHLFGRRPCRQADTEYIENIVKRSSSIVFLPPLPEKATQVMLKHNADTLNVFTTYVRTFVDQHIHGKDNELPLTGLHFGATNSNKTLTDSLPPTKVRSAFVALSGHGDNFANISDLCRTTRGGVFLEEAVIPHLDIYPEESSTPLNAYLYDFFMHGDINALEKGNGVRKSDVWFLLNDFSMVLATICASLANFLKLPESDLSLDDIMGQGDEAENAEDDAFAADSTTETESTAPSVATASTGRTSISTSSANSNKPKTKKVVVDSWEDDAEEAEEEDEEEEEDGGYGEDASKEELERGFLNIYKAFSKLRVEFDMKFRKIFA